MWKKVFTAAEGAEFAETRVKMEARLSGTFWQHVFGEKRPVNMLVWSVCIV